MGSRSVQLDVLRGVAILLVIGAHSSDIPKPDGVIGTFAHFWGAVGWLGVDLFFVLSGFLIGGLLLSEYEKHGTLRPLHFLARRGLKIYPLYLVFLGYLIAMPTAKAVVGGGDAVSVAWTQIEAYWPNLFFLHTYVGDNPAGHTWSLAVEEHFYLTLPFLLLLLAKFGAMHRLLWLCFLAVPILALLARAVSVVSGADYSDTSSDTQGRIDALLFGVGLRGVAMWFPLLFAAVGRYRSVLLVLGLACWSPVWLGADLRESWFRVLGFGLTFIGSGAFLLAALHTDMRNVVARCVAWIGFYSYGIYVWHVTVMGVTDRLIAAPLSDSWLVRIVIVVTSVCVCGALLSRLIEIPVLRLRDRWFPSRSKVDQAVELDELPVRA